MKEIESACIYGDTLVLIGKLFKSGSNSENRDNQISNARGKCQEFHIPSSSPNVDNSALTPRNKNRGKCLSRNMGRKVLKKNQYL